MGFVKRMGDMTIDLATLVIGAPLTVAMKGVGAGAALPIAAVPTLLMGMGLGKNLLRKGRVPLKL